WRQMTFEDGLSCSVGRMVRTSVIRGSGTVLSGASVLRQFTQVTALPMQWHTIAAEVGLFFSAAMGPLASFRTLGNRTARIGCRFSPPQALKRAAAIEWPTMPCDSASSCSEERVPVGSLRILGSGTVHSGLESCRPQALLRVHFMQWTLTPPEVALSFS